MIRICMIWQRKWKFIFFRTSMYKSVSKSFPKYFFIITSNKHLENITWKHTLKHTAWLWMKLQLVLSFPLSYIYICNNHINIYISGLRHVFEGACVRGWNPEISLWKALITVRLCKELCTAWCMSEDHFIVIGSKKIDSKRPAHTAQFASLSDDLNIFLKEGIS